MHLTTIKPHCQWRVIGFSASHLCRVSTVRSRGSQHLPQPPNGGAPSRAVEQMEGAPFPTFLDSLLPRFGRLSVPPLAHWCSKVNFSWNKVRRWRFRTFFRHFHFPLPWGSLRYRFPYHNHRSPNLLLPLLKRDPYLALIPSGFVLRPAERAKTHPQSRRPGSPRSLEVDADLYPIGQSRLFLPYLHARYPTVETARVGDIARYRNLKGGKFDSFILVRSDERRATRRCDWPRIASAASPERKTNRDDVHHQRRPIYERSTKSATHGGHRIGSNS